MSHHPAPAPAPATDQKHMPSWASRALQLRWSKGARPLSHTKVAALLMAEGVPVSYFQVARLLGSR